MPQTSGGGVGTNVTPALIASRRRVRAARRYVKDNPPKWSDTHMPVDKTKTTTTAASSSSGGGGGTGGGGGGGRGNNGGRGGNQGGGGGNNGNDVYQEARRRFRLMMQPYLAQIKDSIREMHQTTNQQNAQTANVYDAFGNTVAGLADPYQAQMSGIQSDLTGNLNAMLPTMQDQIGGAPQAEQAAAMGVVGGIGAGAQSQLATQRSTQAGYNTTAQRAGAEESMIAQRNNLADFANFKENALKSKINLMRQAPAQIDQLVTEIEQRNLNNRLGLGQLAISQGGLDLQRQGLGIEQSAQAQSEALYSALLGYINDYLAQGGSLSDITGVFGGGF